MSGGGTMSGGCLCGAVRFTAAPTSREVAACHCSMCRRWTAGPFLAVDCEATLAVADRTNLGAYRSSDWAERCFCKLCGTPLFYRLLERNHHFASAEAFDDRSGFRFTSQIFVEEKPAYYDFANETHNMTGAEIFAAFPPVSGGDKG